MEYAAIYSIYFICFNIATPSFLSIFKTVIRNKTNPRLMYILDQKVIQNNSQCRMLDPSGTKRSGPKDKKAPKQAAEDRAKHFGERMSKMKHCRCKSLDHNRVGKSTGGFQSMLNKSAKHEFPGGIIEKKIEYRVQPKGTGSRSGPGIIRINSIKTFFRASEKGEKEHDRQINDQGANSSTCISPAKSIIG